MFVYMFRYFIGRKRLQLSEQDKELSPFNRFVIGWTLTLVILNYLHSATNLIYNPLIANFSVMKDEYSYKVFKISFADFFVPLSDFLTVTTLLYLFYFQARKQLNEEVRGRRGGQHHLNDTDLFKEGSPTVMIDVRDDVGEVFKLPSTRTVEQESLMTPHSPQTTEIIGMT